ncbi:hypothetical protein BDZ91DRAFT_720097 [Kalaharituber pfeilii]|nr:hypothetical protein BDZ91DRAFT_720097 [Kalaharituber pfeilii]
MRPQTSSESMDQKLLLREIYGNVGQSSTRGLYGSRKWVDNLDITNELHGHTGCVNALCWSSSGQLLASGSDDTCVNIHTTRPTFVFNTTIETGHIANIFSVKFMPYSSDRKIVSCAGDSEVRVFDIEYAPISSSLGSTARPSASSASRQRPRGPRGHYYSTSLVALPKPAKIYTASEASAKVYTSHTDRVKRIVTENSPYLFLTCSEDGEVRQFDLRQPSEYYSRGNGSAESRARVSFSRHYFGGIDILAGSSSESDDRNPPLISYKKHQIELNTISCSVGQPHYIALGGAHPHCFLHDRRMLGRDKSTEMGQQSSFTESELSAATRCVKRFAPKKSSSTSSSRLRRVRDDGNITACKISDANPNEIVVSWSGDNIYLFDINHSPDEPELRGISGMKAGTGEGRARAEHNRKGKNRAVSVVDTEERQTRELSSPSNGDRNSVGRKRKRGQDTTGGSISSVGEAPPRQRNTRSRSRTGGTDEDILIQYASGETEEVELEKLGRTDNPGSSETPGQSMMRISGLVVDLRKEIFGLHSAKSGPEARGNETLSLRMKTKSFTAAVGLTKVCIERMDDVIHKKKGNDAELDISPQGLTRAHARRFVQVCGALSFALGGRLQTLSPVGVTLTQKYFGQVEGVPGPDDNWHCGVRIQGDELGWRYTFIQLLIDYVKEGLIGVLQRALQNGFEFKDSSTSEEDCVRISRTKLLDSIETWSRDSMDNSPLRDVDSSDVIFPGGEKEAWTTFRGALEAEHQEEPSRRLEFWGVQVARALLMREGTKIRLDLVRTAFEAEEDIVEDERRVESVTIRSRRQQSEETADSGDPMSVDFEDDDDEDLMDMDEFLSSVQRSTGSAFLREEREVNEHSGEGNHEDGDEEDGEQDEEEMEAFEYEDDEEDEEDDDGADDDEEDDDDNLGEFESSIRYRTLWRRRRKEIEAHAPIWNSIRSYSGHCNVKTVKDVNFYGLNDEYVVSGSDCGHVFIWEKKTSKLVQLLLGDEDTVNVVTGHPYEPQIAVSGIEDTVKIFSPDQKAQDEFLGKEKVSKSKNKLGKGKQSEDEDEEEGVREDSRRRLHNEYRIRSQNDAMRDSGVQEALVTRTLLEDLAARLRQRRAEGEDISTFTMGDQCIVS